MTKQRTFSDLPPAVRDWILTVEAIEERLPNVGNFLHQDKDDFRGLTIMIGNRGGYLAILKKWGDTGNDLIMFSNGESPIDALINCEKALMANKWKDEIPYEKKRPSKK